MAKINYRRTSTPNFLKPYLLFHPPIPRPLHGLNPRSIMGQDWWDEHRIYAMAKNNHCCWACGIWKVDAKYKQWLEGHESYITDWKNGILELDEIVSLCHCCHNYIHSGLLESNFRKGRISLEKHNYIMDRGNDLIKPLFKMESIPDERLCQQDWRKWHIIIDGQKHYSNFKNEQDWYNYYNR